MNRKPFNSDIANRNYLAKSQYTGIPITFTFAMGVAAFGSLLALFSSGSLVITKSLLIIVLMSAVIYTRYRKYGFADPVAMFAVAFAMYHGVFLFSVGLQGNSALDTTYPIIFSPQTFSQAASLSIAAAVGIFLAAFVSWSPSSRRPRRSIASTETSSTPVIAGVICLIFGALFTYLDFKQRGGFVAVLEMGRETRYQSVGFEGLSWPFGSFIAAGLAWLAVAQGTKRTRFRVVIFRLAFLIFGLLFVVLGDRRPVVQLIISALAASAALSPELARVTKRKAILVLLVYSVMAFYATFRGEVPKLIAGTATASDVMTKIHDSEALDSMKPEKTDAAGPYLSVLDAVTSVRPLWFGLTYLYALPTVVPGILWPIQKPESLCLQFAGFIHARFYSASSEEAGWGFSPVAEAFQNFGFIGVPLVFFLVTKGFKLLSRLREGNSLQVVLFAVVCSQALNFNRIEFMSFYDEALYSCGAVLFGYLLAKLCTRAVSGSHRSIVRQRIALNHGNHLYAG